jgi:hypothetical protein
MLLDVDDHIEVAGRSTAKPGLATARAAQTRVTVDTGGNFDFDAACFFDPALTLARWTGLFDNAPRTVAGRAGLCDLEKASRGDDWAAAAAGARSPEMIWSRF